MNAVAHDSLYDLRHSTAHLMAQAVGELFPGVKYAIGPPIEDGFYYDIEFQEPLKEEDLKRIEDKMREIAGRDLPIVRETMERADARAFEEAQAQPYKVALIDDLPEGEVISFYRQGDWIDLCRGPHLPSTGHIKHFKLLNLAGAYWRGSEKNKMLTRIYGTAWPTKQELYDYLERLEQAKLRDHRKLGKELGLFVFAPEAIGSGIPLFLPKGEMLRHVMESYVREVQTRYGYQHVWTGHLVREDLYKKSGHYENYADVMFPPMKDEEAGINYRLKPMNCPSHMTLFNSQYHSYRDLPLRYAEFATLYRYEKTGELNGLTRVRALTQDDCHIFCTEDQIESEFALALKLIREVLTRYGFTDYKVRLSLKGEEPGGKYVADDEKWTKATNALRSALDANAVEYVEAPGEAAFYGPKADFLTRDALGREWQISTIQVDFIQPARLGCKYIDAESNEQTPVVLHRAVTGTTERFLGVLIEQYAGAFPFWLAPEQVAIIPIAERHYAYANEVSEKLKAAGFRIKMDDRNEKMGKRIRESEMQKIPVMLILGDKDIENQTVSVRRRTEGDLDAMSLNDALALFAQYRDA
ncbi:MAG: Ser-tRNA(Thr) hydrolase / threonyl-tRNA synthetase [Chthonomonadales bacterium]|nr:Ser-tRNA(Thr) hydrolase / threonyl-tRNA synthetase [Chthonomonadales bacterium]